MKLKILFLISTLLLSAMPAQAGGLGFNVKPAPLTSPYIISAPDSRLPNATVFDPSGTGDLTSFDMSVPSFFSVAGVPDLTGSVSVTVSYATGLSANKVLMTDGSGVAQLGSLTASHIPNLPASIITSGQLAVAQGGTAAATATAHTFFGNNTGSTAAPAFSSLTASDIPNIAESQVTNLTTDLGNKQPLDTLLTAISGLSGTASQVLRRNAGNTAYEFATLSAGFTNPMTTTGDIIYSSDNSGTAARLARGSSGQLLAMGGSSIPLWTTPTYPITSQSSGKVLVSDGTNFVASTPTFPNASATSGKIIQSDGTNWIASTATHPTAATNNKIIVGNGTNYVESTPTFPNASATSGKIIKSDGTNWVASTETYAAPGTSGNVLTSDGTNWTSAAAAGGGSSNSMPATATPWSVRQAICGSTDAATYKDLGIAMSAPTSAFAVTTSKFSPSANGGAGMFLLVATTTSSGNDAGCTSAATVCDPITTGAKLFFRVRTSTPLTSQRIWVGVTSNAATQDAAADPVTYHLGFRFDTSASDTKWQAVANDNSGGGSISDTGVTVAANTCYSFCIDCSDPASIKYYVDGVLGATITGTNIPDAGNALAANINIRTLTAAERDLFCGAIRIEER